MRRRSRLAIALAAATVAAVAAGLYFARGDRHRLYWDPHAGHCWNAIETLALSSSSLRPMSIVAARTEAGGTRVDIRYRLDGALGGAALDAVCEYDAGERRARSIEIGGMPVEGETLNRINDGEI